jgi:hypothetical protein
MTILDTNVLSELMRPSALLELWQGLPNNQQQNFLQHQSPRRKSFIARVRSAKLATRKVEDFEDCGVDVVDPSNGA